MATLSNKATQIETEHERSPQEAALMIWLRVLIATRWTAIPLVVIATLVATMVFNIGFATLPVYCICAFIAVYNLVLLLQAQLLFQ